jgi:hypothetical protein
MAGELEARQSRRATVTVTQLRYSDFEAAPMQAVGRPVVHMYHVLLRSDEIRHFTDLGWTPHATLLGRKLFT